MGKGTKKYLVFSRWSLSFLRAVARNTGAGPPTQWALHGKTVIMDAIVSIVSIVSIVVMVLIDGVVRGGGAEMLMNC